MDIVTRTSQDVDIKNAIKAIDSRMDIGLIDLLVELSEYMDDRADVRDGTEGEALPNDAMILGMKIDTLLEVLEDTIQ